MTSIVRLSQVCERELENGYTVGSHSSHCCKMVWNTHAFLLYVDNASLSTDSTPMPTDFLKQCKALSTADPLLPALTVKCFLALFSISSTGADTDGISQSFPIITTALYTTTLFIQLFPQQTLSVLLTHGAVTTTCIW